LTTQDATRSLSRSLALSLTRSLSCRARALSRSRALSRLTRSPRGLPAASSGAGIVGSGESPVFSLSLRVHTGRMLICACNPTLCSIHVFRSQRPPFISRPQTHHSKEPTSPAGWVEPVFCLLLLCFSSCRSVLKIFLVPSSSPPPPPRFISPSPYR